MTELNQIYKCNVCGNIVGGLHAGTGQLVCCEQPMQLLLEKNKEEGLEKHVPVIEENESGVRVKVGAIPHPMEQTHHLEWIEAIGGGKVYRKFLNPGEKPEVNFDLKAAVIIAKTYCNLHGLWKS